MPLRRLASIALAGALSLGAVAAHAQSDALRAARDAQRRFELTRRQRLPAFPGGGGGPCEIRVGRLCYWNNNGEPIPPEPAAIADARATLLERLAAAASADSTDDWIVGQYVRYALESGRIDDALAAAGRCAGTRWWCAALRGFAQHVGGHHADATAAFDTALAAMAERERCAWTDVAPWLGDALRREYGRTRCGEERDAWLQRFWLAARPLLVLEGSELRDELLSRRVMTRIQAHAANPYGMSWGDDMAELEIRYGAPVAWSARYAATIGGERSVVGHEPTPSWAFVPVDASPVAAPPRAGAEAWDLDARLPEMRYAPRYAPNGFLPLPHQVARFRRGDSTIVVVGWDVTRDSAWLRDTSATRDPATADSLLAGVVLVDETGIARRVVRDGATAHGALVVGAPPRAALLSVELLSRARGRAARARYAIDALADDALLSDVLLLARAPDTTVAFDRVTALALGTTTIAPGAAIGLYWETYFPPDVPSPTSIDVTIRATRVDAAWYARLGRALRLDGVLGGAPASPIAVQLTDVARPGERQRERAIGLTWPSDARGTYRLDVTIHAGGRTATSTQIVRVR